jgi:hypothetical protein
MNRLRLRAAVGLLTGHTTLRAHIYKPGHRTARMPTVDMIKEDSVYIVHHCPALAGKRYRIRGNMFLKPEDLEKMSMGSLLNLVANTGLGLIL